jgi:hypothetical protein
MLALQFTPWVCRGIFLGSSHFGTIFSYTHILQHHLSSHHITPWIKWLLLALLNYELDKDFEFSSDFFKMAF